jgi:PAS domain S-box-containing protein
VNVLIPFTFFIESTGCLLDQKLKAIVQNIRECTTQYRFVFSVFFIIVSGTSAASESAPDLNLTEAERAWLESHPSVTFTGDPNWLPYEAFDSNGEYIGIVSEHLDLIAQITGIKFQMSPSKTWTESTEKAKKGVVDILSETDDSDLASHLNFTSSYVSNPIVIAMQDKENFVENIDSIKDRTIGVIKDYGYVSKILRKYKKHNFIVVDNIQDGLVSVSTGQVDALLCTLALCSYTIAQLGLNNVKITGKTEFDTKLALGVQKDLPELLSILNKAIVKIKPEQRQTILDGWIKQKFVEKTDYTLVYQVVTIAVVILGIFIFWNRRLSREINLRIATEKELNVAQQRLVSHFEHTPLAVIEWNTDFEFVNWNPAAQRIFGFTKQEVLGRHITECILPESVRGHVNKIWSDLLADRGGRHSTNENLTKDGRTILCEWYNTPLVGPDGKVIGVASLVDDITERMQAEEALKESEIRYRSVIATMAEGIVVQDADAQISAFNSSALKILGLTEDQLLGRTSMDPRWRAVHDDGSPFPGDAHPGVVSLRTGKSVSNVVMGVHRPDDSLVWISINSEPLLREGGDMPIGSVASFTDITERRKAEQELEQYRNHLEVMVSERTAALEVANKELEAFSYSVSHDLRSPLRSIDGFSHALIEDYSEVIDGAGNNFLHRIRDNAQHMGKLIDAILSLSRVTRSDFNPEVVDLSALAHETINKYQDDEPERKVDIQIMPNIKQMADKSLVGIVLDNLLGNAWKYTGKVDNARIEFGTIEKDNRTIYYVSDNGAGFDMKYVNKLFGAFQRLHKPEEFEGTGIGLVTVSRIVRRHGGEVWAEAKPDQGATFSFTLNAHDESGGMLKQKQVI